MSARKSVSSDEEEEETFRSSKKGAMTFALLAQHSDEASADSGDDSGKERPQVPKPDAKKKKAQTKTIEEPSVIDDKYQPSSGAADQKKKKPKAKGKPKTVAGGDSEDDIDKILANLEGKAPDSVPDKTATAAPVTELEEQAPSLNEETKKSRTAADKRKEKRLKQKEGQKGTAASEVAADVKPEAVAEAEEASEASENEAKEETKKKKKKKAKDEKEKSSKPPSKQVAFMKEALKKAQEEEEKRKKQLEEEEQRRIEAENKLLEKLKKEEERKRKKREKEKERIQRQKEAGTYMTAEQKLKAQRAKELVQKMMEEGVVPAPGKTEGPKRVKYVDKKKQKKTEQPVALTNENEITPERQISESVPMEKDVITEVAEEQEEDVMDSWDQIDAIDEETAAEGDAVIDEDKASATESEESEEDEEEDESSEDEASTSSSEATEKETAEVISPNETKEEARARIVSRIKKRQRDAELSKSAEEFRSPIVCVLGHVDVGKTKILDKIRRTNVQDGEAGGITQQIGATMVPVVAVKEQTKMVKDFKDLKLPGLLIIDTPGHESFSNLRSRGSSLCDVAILVVDIMHGIEPQTLESIELLKSRKTPFVIALNKVDRLYEWKRNPHKDIREVMKAQQRNTELEFKDRVAEVVTQFAEQGLNVALFYDNPDPNEYYSLVPVSAITGDGMGNLMACLISYAQTTLAKRLLYCEALQCTILEVKALTGLGTTIDVILVNGRLNVGDTIVLPGVEGPIVTQIRELLMPQPLKEMRVKNPYEHYKQLQGAQGIKILAKDLEKALAGLQLHVAVKEDEIEILKEEVELSLRQALQSINLSDCGVYVQASTLGSLEALLTFLRDSKIPYSGINIGPVHKRDVMKSSAMLERDESHYAVILAFDVKVEREAQELADQLGVRIFQADIIYHLFDAFTKYTDDWKKKKRDENAHLAVFPCKLRILPEHVYNARNPLVMGVIIESGIVKIGTPLVVPSKENIFLGNVSSIESNHKPVEFARTGQEVCIKIEHTGGDAPKLYGRHFDYQDLLISRISRDTIDVCKKYFRDDLQKSDWQLIVELKKTFGII